MNIRIEINAESPEELQHALRCLIKDELPVAKEKTVDASSFRAASRSGAALPAVPVDQQEAVESDDEGTDNAQRDGGDEIADKLPPVKAKAAKKGVADKVGSAVVGSIPSAPKAVPAAPAKAPAKKAAAAADAPPTRDEAKALMEKYVAKHGTIDMVKKLGDMGARRLSDVPDERLAEFVKAISE